MTFRPPTQTPGLWGYGCPDPQVETALPHPQFGAAVTPEPLVLPSTRIHILPENVALRKPAAQSGAWSVWTGPDKAVDGDPRDEGFLSPFVGPSCSHPGEALERFSFKTHNQFWHHQITATSNRRQIIPLNPLLV